MSDFLNHRIGSNWILYNIYIYLYIYILEILNVQTNPLPTPLVPLQDSKVMIRKVLHWPQLGIFGTMTASCAKPRQKAPGCFTSRCHSQAETMCCICSDCPCYYTGPQATSPRSAATFQRNTLEVWKWLEKQTIVNIEITCG